MLARVAKVARRAAAAPAGRRHMSSEPFADGVVRVNHPKSLYLNKPGGNRAAVDYHSYHATFEPPFSLNVSKMLLFGVIIVPTLATLGIGEISHRKAGFK